MKVLINLVGKQQQPNTLAALHVRPDAIVQVCKGDEFLPQIDHFVAHCRETMGILHFFVLKLQLRTFSMAPNEADKLTRRISDWQREIQARRIAAGEAVPETGEPIELLVNLTGGTKLMAVALQQYALKNGHRCLYVDERAILDSDNGRFPLPDTTLADLIGPMGYVCASETPPLSAIDVEALWTAHQADPNGYSQFCYWLFMNQIDLKAYDCALQWRNPQALLDRLANAGFLSYTKAEAAGRFDIEFRRNEVKEVLRLHGTVLELALLQVLQRVQTRLEGTLRLYPNVKIRHRTAPNNGFSDENEFDLVAVYEGRVFFFECKITRKAERVAQMLDGFLTSTARYGGASANRCLVRPKPYSDKNLEKKARDRRVQLLGIGALDDEDTVNRLAHYLRQPEKGLV
jgi:hypothetical protein